MLDGRVPSAPKDLGTKEEGGSARTMDGDLAIGRVVSVSGSQVVALLDEGMGALGSHAAPPLQIGALVKVSTATATVYGLVCGLSIPIPRVGPDDPEHRIFELDLVGESPETAHDSLGGFRRGVSVFPALGDLVLLGCRNDLERVYGRDGLASVRIGTIHQDRNVPAQIVVDQLLGKHFAVVGSTGSGKSCAVALILSAILSRHPSGHVLLLDLHNEYGRAFGDMAETLDTNTLELPYWLLTLDEFSQIILPDQGDSSRDQQLRVLNDVIIEAKRRFLGSAQSDRQLSADTPIPYRLGDVARLLDEAMGRLDKPNEVTPYLRIKARLTALQQDRRFGFMFPSGLSVRDNMAALLSKIFRIPVNGRPLMILDLSGVPSDVLGVVISVLCRLTFDLALWSEQMTPIVLVCEEAHRYASRESSNGADAAAFSLSRLAKEGRKYGISVCVVSQRPSDLAPGILSQCNTTFALRLSNQRDQEFIRGATSESASGMLDFLPSLRDAEAVVVGEGVPMPMRISFDDLAPEQRPSRATALFSEAWRDDTADQDQLKNTVERWRWSR